MKITTENLTKHYGPTVAVENLSIELASGKLIALLGPSGCGKTTILNMFSGILPVTSGKIFFDGKDVTDLPAQKREVGLVFQNYALYPHMSVLANICFPLEIKRIPKAERLKRATKMAEMVHIGDLLKRKPAELSGGQQQRVAIARALVKEPKLLLLDEPLSNLDAKLRLEMREEIRRIQRESQVTTIFVTHDQEEASSIADEVVLLKLGHLQQKASAAELYNNPANLFVADFLGTPTINKLAGSYKKGKFYWENSNLSYPFSLNNNVPNDQAKLWLAARAESIIMADKSGLPAVVNELYTLGKDELAILDIGGQTVRCYLSSELGLKEGMSINVCFKDKGVFLFDQESGERFV